jgi:hypothetical protein
MLTCAAVVHYVYDGYAFQTRTYKCVNVLFLAFCLNVYSFCPSFPLYISFFLSSGHISISLFPYLLVCLFVSSLPFSFLILIFLSLFNFVQSSLNNYFYLRVLRPVAYLSNWFFMRPSIATKFQYIPLIFFFTHYMFRPLRAILR